MTKKNYSYYDSIGEVLSDLGILEKVFNDRLAEYQNQMFDPETGSILKRPYWLVDKESISWDQKRELGSNPNPKYPDAVNFFNGLSESEKKMFLTGALYASVNSELNMTLDDFGCYPGFETIWESDEWDAQSQFEYTFKFPAKYKE